MTMTRIVLVALLLIVPAVASARQQPPPPATPPPTTPPAGGQSQPQPEAAKGAAKPAYAYDPAGRRDPFVSLLGRGEETPTQGPRPSGVSGLLIGEVTVKGVLRDKGGYLAMLRAPDNKTYTVRVGDRLLDGSVKSINQDKVIFSQDVNDPLSLVKQREVPKPVRQAEGRGE